MGDVAREVRVHGVGGAPGPKQLGLRDPIDTVTLRDWGATRVLARRAVWIVLLPFTLLNAAGWMHPRVVGKRYRWLNAIERVVIVMLGFVLTAAYAMWLVDLVVGVVASGWGPRFTGRKPRSVPAWLPGPSSYAADDLRTALVYAGFGVVVLIISFLLKLASGSRATEQGAQPDLNPGHPTWATGEGLESMGFFRRRRPWYAAWGSHAIAVVLTVGAGIALAWYQLNNRSLRFRRASFDAARQRLDFDAGLLVLAAFASVLLVVLCATSWLVPLVRKHIAPAEGDPPVVGRAFGAAVLAFVVANGLFVGLELWASAALGSRPRVADRPDTLPLGRAMAIADPFVLSLVAWGVVAFVLWRVRARGAKHAPAPVGGLPDPLPTDRWQGVTAEARSTARLAHRADALAVVLALPAMVLTIGLLGQHLSSASSTLRVWDDGFEAPDPRGFLLRVATWLVPLSVAAGFLIVRKAISESAPRRAIAQMWDILAFWPRRFHPLALRSYAERAVPELRDHVVEQASEAGSAGAVISAHSQGSVLTVAALAPIAAMAAKVDADEKPVSLTKEEVDQVTALHRTALVTYGSPVQVLFGRAFPAYFHADAFEALSKHLHPGGGKGWANFTRATDPIGGPQFGNSAIEEYLADPSPSDTSPLPFNAPGMEPDRLRADGLAVHSHYDREPRLKAQVCAYKRALHPESDVPSAPCQEQCHRAATWTTCTPEVRTT